MRGSKSGSPLGGEVAQGTGAQAGVTNRERGLDRILHARPRPDIYGRVGSASDRVGINPAEGRPLFSYTDCPKD